MAKLNSDSLPLQDQLVSWLLQIIASAAVGFYQGPVGSLKFKAYLVAPLSDINDYLNI